MTESRSGQIMVLTVLALGGTILGATTIAGLLMLYQIRQSTDLANSAKAIFAADAGIEKSFYDISCAGNADKQPCPAPPDTGTWKLSNGATANIVCSDGNGDPIGTCASDQVRVIRSVGSAGTASRAFEVDF